jgi:hypothetical protein
VLGRTARGLLPAAPGIAPAGNHQTRAGVDFALEQLEIPLPVLVIDERSVKQDSLLAVPAHAHCLVEVQAERALQVLNQLADAWDPRPKHTGFGVDNDMDKPVPGSRQNPLLDEAGVDGPSAPPTFA